MENSNADFIKLESSSGIPIWFFPMPYLRTVSIGILVNAGARDEKAGEEGLAHALEHMLFQGAEDFPDHHQLTHYIESVGGHLGGWTSQEATFYHCDLPAEKAERGFRALSQMLRRPLLPPEKIISEMKVVTQEIRMIHDEPASHVGGLLQKMLYGSHPLSKEIGGSEASVASFTQITFRDFMSRFYHPANYVFVIAGSIGAEEAAGFFDRYFPEPITRPARQRTLVFEAEPERKECVEARANLEQAQIMLGALTTDASHRLIPALDMFQVMIGGGMSSPLFEEVRDKRGLCYDIQAGHADVSDLGHFIIYVATDPERIEEAVDAIVEVIQHSKSSAALLEQAKEMALGNLAFRGQSPDEMINLVAHEVALYGHPKSYDELVDAARGVTIAEVEEAVDLYLPTEKIVIAMIVPKE